MREVRVGGHPERYWRSAGELPFSVENEAQNSELWNAMSKEFTGQLAMMAFPRKWNRASGRELHFKLSKEDNDHYIEVARQVAILIKAYLCASNAERRIFQSVANQVLEDSAR